MDFVVNKTERRTREESGVSSVCRLEHSMQNFWTRESERLERAAKKVVSMVGEWAVKKFRENTENYILVNLPAWNVLR